MLKKMSMMAAMMMVAMTSVAQETYENAKIVAEDLNGTARYVGMGGAMEALGADISTISTNPAGIGLFRRSNAEVSFGIVSQSGVNSAVGGDKTNVSFDQAGFVYSARMGKTSFLNVAFNYHKSRNFNMILSASDVLDNASLNKLTYAKALVSGRMLAANQGSLLYGQQPGTPITDSDGNINYVPNYNSPYISCNQLDNIYTPLIYDGMWAYIPASGYQFNRAHKGYVGEYDFNISGNINNRVYLGLTVGIHDVHYKHYSEYVDKALDATFTDITTADSREITGTGYDVKVGAIIRPIESSPFRIGLSVTSPTFYTLTTSNYTYVTDGYNTASSSNTADGRARMSYKFKLFTPWKFGLSAGYTIGNNVALGVSYEFTDYSSMDTRYIGDSYYDSWSDSYYDRSASDKVMNDHTDRTLRSVHTLKLGAEIKPVKNLAVRVGYNYVSPMYRSEGFKDGTLDSDASYISSAADYTNWKDTHRVTCGLGYTINKFNISLAYQYSTTKGEFHPFMNYVDDYSFADDNVARTQTVKNNRHQLLMTLGYTF
jgi:hypothetical protein